MISEGHSELENIETTSYVGLEGSGVILRSTVESGIAVLIFNFVLCSICTLSVRSVRFGPWLCTVIFISALEYGYFRGFVRLFPYLSTAISVVS
jgi:hypothetical protein